MIVFRLEAGVLAISSVSYRPVMDGSATAGTTVLELYVV